MDNKQNEINKNIIIVLLFFILIFMILLIISSIHLYNKNRDKVTYLNNIIESNSKKNGQKAFLEIKSISQVFAKIKGTNNGYCFASDGKYNYVVYLDTNKATELYKKDLENEPVKLTGVTKSVSNNVKKNSH